MEKYVDGFIASISGSFNWTLKSILFEVPWYTNFFWGIVVISLIVYGLEILFPWRKNQSIIRKDFWLDAFYMFFNFFVFAIVISGFYKILELFFIDLGLTMNSLAIIDLSTLASWAQLLLFFIVLDFVQWVTHIVLHTNKFLWQFHQIHHSVKEMGFAAHMRYHWMENVIYKPLKTLGVMLLGGFEPEQAIIVHFIAVSIGHLNHSNIKLSWGPLKYIINNPVMHLYHHAYEIPEGKNGINYGISLSLWDYIFKTNYIPEDSGTITLGFPGDEKVPPGFLKQLFYGFRKNKN
ncbi:sterol desaturase family protein [Aurantibacter crassamenti]|uniref:sterol desaturase family protein n=1 Tax=Aurantibacter crassamenti TaxID=1837375 RepID=UPI001939D68D|nr:sterol desaturase family protein [Aurantibacter crassamenti]MBM1106897.1 sterol desaturase family protein [Aurantibacter crassamenti]